MRNVLVYDWPTRIFHWLFAGLFLTAFLIAKLVDDETLLFVFHMFAGLTLGYAVVLRIVWGFVGSRYARFNSFALKPSQLISYFKNIKSGTTQDFSGHNPASSWASLGMMAMGLSLVTSGFLMVQKIGKEVFEELHELFAYAFLALVVAHVLGIILHTIKNKDIIGLSMLDGKKKTQIANAAIDKSYVATGFVFLILVISFVLNLLAQFNLETRQLNLFGATLNFASEEKSDKIEKD